MVWSNSVINDEDTLISVKDAARECGKNPETVRRWIWSGKLPAEKMGNQLFVRRKALASFLRESSGAAGSAELQAAAAATPENSPAAERADTNSETERAAVARGTAAEGAGKAGVAVATVVKGGRADIIWRMARLRQEIRDRAGNLDVEHDSDKSGKEGI
jgi:excisionase family DNA binding protein